MRAKKHLGQHFLVDERIVNKIIHAINPLADETILEIGAGRGALTEALVGKVGRLVAIEVDPDLIPILLHHCGGKGNFTLIEQSALTLDFRESILPSATARVVANLPYYISTALLQRLLEERGTVTEMFLMLQREVVKRITAEPGSSERGYLSVLAQAHCDMDILFDVPPSSFRPVPKVWSSVLRLSFKPQLPNESEAIISWSLVSAAFMHRRKTILNNFRAAPESLRDSIENVGGANRMLERSAIDPARRAETLTLGEWASLSKTISDS